MSVTSFDSEVTQKLLKMIMNEIKEFRRRCDDTIDFPGGNTANSKVIDEIMSNVGKKVTVKLLLKCDAQRKFVNVVDLQFEG
jgi:hypothetical protein